MPAMKSTEDITRFIASTFRSVWSLELLLLLKREPKRWSQEELLSALRASELVVTQALNSLVAAGLVSVDEGGVSYAPATGDLSELVDATEAHYAKKPDAVRRTIIASASSGMTAFADAFRLRKD
jgi:DNA-binding HxlR family transcriptional regulator